MLYLVFRLGNDRYAMDVRQIVEVIPLVNWKGVPGGLPGLAGMIDFHGQPLPLIDLTELATGEPSRKRMSTRILVVNYRHDSLGEAHSLALMAEQVTETISRTEEEFVSSGLSVEDAGYLGSVTTGPGGIVQRVEINDLLSERVRNQLFPSHLGSK
jgi:chemotaxis-related protein WspB